MLNTPRLTLFVVTAFLASVIPVASLEAQKTPLKAQTAFVDEVMNIKMPFVLREFSPMISRVKALCRVFQADGLELSSTESVTQETSLKDGKGVLSGELSTSHAFKRSLGMTGTPGRYSCVLEGETASGNGEAFSANAQNPIFRIPSGITEVTGTFTW